MSDLHATKERLAEALELERLRKENATLRARWNDRVLVSDQAYRLNVSNLRAEAASYSSALLRAQMAQSALPSLFGGAFGRLFG